MPGAATASACTGFADGAFSPVDLTARHPRTGGLLSSMTFTVQTLAAAGEIQRDLTYDVLRATKAKGI
ncbi:hypothetical protein ACWEWP_33555 [Streptomyces olivaceus]